MNVCRMIALLKSALPPCISTGNRSLDLMVRLETAPSHGSPKRSALGKYRESEPNNETSFVTSIYRQSRVSAGGVEILGWVLYTAGSFSTITCGVAAQDCGAESLTNVRKKSTIIICVAPSMPVAAPPTRFAKCSCGSFGNTLAAVTGRSPGNTWTVDSPGQSPAALPLI